MNKIQYERERNGRNEELPIIFIFPIEKEIKWNLEEKKSNGKMTRVGVVESNP